ncbi:MAG TPA: CHAT domain-containing tetratricopeptide repeat protein [Allosphingosinicella sp.]|nr:CHAT domain-containing tetratricopeptide repeat protein [Allosphingosinicella sp.]
MTSLSKRMAVLAGIGAGALLLGAGAGAQGLSVQQSFRIGSGTGTLCTAESQIRSPAFGTMFDRGYQIVCRDAAVPVGQLYVLRLRGGPDPAPRLAQLRGATATCQGSETVEIEGLGQVEALSCRLNEADVSYRVYLRRSGRSLYVAEGLGGYDSALRLGLRSLAADREIEGEVQIATTGAGDPAAFARVQAGAQDPQRALAEAYRRNNAGAYAEASEYFAALVQRDTGPGGRAEALVNQALQRSNLGRYAEADAMFARAAEMAGGDPVTARRLRNYRAMHLLNQGMAPQALTELDRPMPPVGGSRAVGDLVIDRPTAGRLSAESPGAGRLRGPEGLTPEDKAQILDGQALHLRGVILHLQRRDADAVAPLNRALTELIAVRGGRIAATVWLRAQVHGELADIAEARGDQAETDRQHQTAILLLETNYPGSAALYSAKARLAGYYARTGRAEPARTMFREIVQANLDTGDSSPALRRLIEPYFELLVQDGAGPTATADLFTASQILVRPGVAQTQAILARELSGGSDEAARMFRQSVTLTRDIERARVELARLQPTDQPTAASAARIVELRASIEQWERDQAAMQARLAQFPRYRAVSSGALQLADLQALLRPGEAYYKMLVLGDHAYAIFMTREAARAFRIGASPRDLDRQVDALRTTISVVQNGQQLTYPFDLEGSYRLYQELFGPVGGELAGVRHLVFEPDGAMMRLPPNLLVMDRAAIDAYRSRMAANPSDDGFDFRGVQWLGRERDISTAVSARAFRDVRNAPPSRARAEYLGFGENEPARGFYLPGGGGTRGADAMQPGCSWSLAAWNRPISARELRVAGDAAAMGRAGEAEIVTGSAFTDTGIIARSDLDQYRILHFATHGLTTPPRPECPARPALLTSFGGAGSDGLLSFAEIYDLRLDADLIILSACDTASRGSATASAEAGLSSSGEYALDGLVRAFVGAGGRIIVASHWPVPEDFNATERLISGMFRAPPGTGTAGALRQAQRALMDERDTSHPYYWSGFAVVGDGAAPVVRQAPTRTAAAY